MVEDKIEKPREGLLKQNISYERKMVRYEKEEIREYLEDGVDYQDHYATIFIGDENE